MHIAYKWLSEMKSSLKSDASGTSKRASTGQWALRPQDVVVALKLVAMRGQWLPYAELGKQLKLSQFEAHAAVRRLLAAKLITDIEGEIRPINATLKLFIYYGAPYAFPPVRGEMTIGFPTAYGMSPLKEKVLFADENPPVWPSPEGTTRGMTLLPLYEKAPLAALEDRALYEMLALFDALRIGAAREREMAIAFLEERFR
jgi:DNA-binding Lrp family transcriptional regulator